MPRNIDSDRLRPVLTNDGSFGGIPITKKRATELIPIPWSQKWVIFYAWQLLGPVLTYTQWCMGHYWDVLTRSKSEEKPVNRLPQPDECLGFRLITFCYSPLKEVSKQQPKCIFLIIHLQGYKVMVFLKQRKNIWGEKSQNLQTFDTFDDWDLLRISKTLTGSLCSQAPPTSFCTTSVNHEVKKLLVYHTVSHTTFLSAWTHPSCPSNLRSLGYFRSKGSVHFCFLLIG